MGYGYCAKCCSVSVTGSVAGCFTGIVGVSIALKDHLTGSPLGTVTTGTGGALIGATVAASNGQSVDATITLARFSTFTTTKTVSGGVLSLSTMALSADSSHVCISDCNLPIAKTLTWTGSGSPCVVGGGVAGTAYANCTLNFGTPPGVSLSGQFWYATVNNTISGFAGGTCTGGSTVTFPYFWWSPQNGVGVSDPTQLSTCKSIGVNNATAASEICPTISGTNFSRTYNCTANNIAGVLSE